MKVTILEWIKVVWWVVRGRPIIHKVIFNGGFTLDKNNRNVLILGNTFKEK